MLHPEDAINRRELCELFKVNTSEMTAAAISTRAAFIRTKWSLKEYRDPVGNGFLYSKEEAMKVWAKLQPLTRKQAA